MAPELFCGKENKLMGSQLCWQVSRYFRQVRGLSLVFALALLLGASAMPAKAQSYLQNIGVPPFTTQLPVENGFVNVANGDLHLEIPLGSFPQRSGAPDKIVLMYDSTIWQPIMYSGVQGWRPTNIPNSYGSPYFNVWGGWRPVTSREGGFDSFGETDSGYCTRMDDYYWATYSPWIWTAPDGTQHSFQASTKAPIYPGICGAAGSGIPSATAYASDGSGFFISITNYTNAVVYAPDGTKMGGAYASEDSNGNYAPYINHTYNPTTNVDTWVYTDTVGRTILTETNNRSTNAYTFVVPNPQGTTSTYTTLTQPISVNTYFGQAGQAEFVGTITVVSEIDLPDGTKYTFTYDSGTTPGYYGLVKSMTLPTGGTISYSFFNDVDAYGNFFRRISGRGTPDGSWLYTYLFPWGHSCTSTQVDCQQRVAVSKPNGDGMTYTFALNGGAWPVQVQYTASGGTLVATTTQCFSFVLVSNQSCSYTVTTAPAATNVHLLATTTTLPMPGSSNISATTGYTWDNGNQGKYGEVTQISEWNFGSSTANAADRTTSISYLGGSAYLNANILNRPSNVTISSGAQTLYSYDGGSLTSLTGMPGHDDGGYGTNNTARGNVTIVQQLVSGSTYLNSTATYDMTGQLLTSTEPNGAQTTLNYGCANAYPTTIRNALSQATQLGYDCNTGLVTSITDPNNQPTGFSYDNMFRPTQINYPDGGQTLFTYWNSNGFVQTLEQRKIDSSRWTYFYTLFDGLGRKTRTATANDESSPYDQVDTCYDTRGNVGFQSYPYQGTGFNASPVCTGAGDTFAYDALNRVTRVTHSDGSAIITSYSGRATSVTDEGNFSYAPTRVSQTDAWGRLTSVCEVSSNTQIGTGGTPAACGQDIAATGFLTLYFYDAMDNLTSLTQGGYSNRYSSYDSLSRLVSTYNDESGGTIYYYTTPGGALCAGDVSLPCRRTDARGITTTYAYDFLKRLTSKTYSDTTPAAYFYYDASSWWGHSVSNPVGRLVAKGTYIASTGVWPTSENFTYDAMGRASQEYSCLPIMCWSGSGVGYVIQSHGYDYVGDMVSSTNGAGVTLNYSYNKAQRLTGITSSLNDSNHPSPLFSGAHYNGAGSLLSATLDNGIINESRCYDGRFRLEKISDTALSNTLYSLTVPSSGYCGYSGIWGYAPDNNIVGAWDSANGNWSYAYDPFNRLASATATGQSYTYDYDRFGNRWHQNGPHSMMESFSSGNRMDPGTPGYTYDADGNLTYDGTTTYTYDAENRVISATNSSSGTSTYVYNADGQRVRKTVSGVITDFLYDLNGNQVAAVNGSGAWIRGEVYAAGRHFATYSGGTSGTTYFNFADHLGTERVRATVSGTVAETCTSLPFGDWLTCTGGDPSPMHFTGYERDWDSGLDNAQARYYGSSLGRFMSGDPVPGDIPDPQSLNRYAYVRNNPVNSTDPSGLCAADLIGGGDCGGFGFGFGFGFGWGWGRWDDGRIGRQPPIYTPPNVGTSPNPFNGETFGIPNGIQIPMLGLPGILLPNDPSCDFGCDFRRQRPHAPINGQWPTSWLMQAWLATHWPFGSPKGKWWPSKETGSCSKYADSGRTGLAGICSSFGDGPHMDSIRGCLQEFYNPNFSDGVGGYENHPGLSGEHSGRGGLNGSVGVAAHTYCVPEGVSNP
jgi:RHS repeat-associated protein